MNSEKLFAQYICDTRFNDIPADVIAAIKNVILNIAGTVAAGATREGCQAVVDQVREWGGTKEATILIHGGKVPAHNAAFANGYMARALDIDDAMFPGMHVGASTVSTALAIAELVGNCSGQDFLTALIIGHETAARFNSVTDYYGFDPTGVCTIMGTAAVAAKMFNLSPSQILDTLALAFDKAGGTFQCNVDGALAVRANNGFSAQSGIVCAQLAKRGITGPKNFIEGIYGYLHLFGMDKYTVNTLTNKLGKDYLFHTNLLFKKHPSCACTEAGTDAILFIMKENGVQEKDVDRIEIKLSPIAFRLVGHPFEVGDNPTVNAQFSVRYCVASALLRGGSSLKYFEESQIRDPRISAIINKINIICDQSLEGKLEVHLMADMKVTTKNGKVHTKAFKQPRGAPENPLTAEEFKENFRDYISAAGKPLPPKNVEKIVSMIDKMEQVKDIRDLVPLLVV
jgi:2-methylcitrate dehydratase PrpD